MDKNTAIVIIASIVIVVPFAYSGWNIYAAEHIQAMWPQKTSAGLYNFLNEREVILCNPLPFFVSLDGYEITTVFNQKNLGTFSSPAVFLMPLSAVTINPTFQSDQYEEVQYTLLHMDGQFSGSTPVRIDPSRFFMATEIQTPIIGVIPYSVVQQQGGFDFRNSMLGNGTDFSC